jgi:hypothetical protein
LQFAGELIGQGKEAARKALAEKPELMKKITEAIMLKRSGVVAEEGAKGEKGEKAEKPEKADKAEKSKG